MKLPRPPLDDRSHAEIVEDAILRIDHLSRGRGWTDLSASDPGRTLLELFAYVTEQLQYRLNRLPERHYVALLEMIGVRLLPPVAAIVEVDLGLPDAHTPPLAESVTLPRGSVVRTDAGDESIAFTLARDLELAAGERTWRGVPAYNATLHALDPTAPRVVGRGNGQAGLRIQLPASQVPVVANLRDLPSFRLWVEEEPGTEGTLSIGADPFSVWREVDDFSDTSPDEPVYRLDRVSGEVEFAPAVRRREAMTPARVRLELSDQPGAPFRLDLVDDGGDGTRRRSLRVTSQEASLTFADDCVWKLGPRIQVVECEPSDDGSSALLTVEFDPAVELGWRDVLLERGDGAWVAEAAIRVLSPLLETRPVPRGRVPGVGKRIVAEWWSGGGELGNIGAHTLSRVDPAGSVELRLEVDNKRPATGGRGVETVENALLRGPQELKELRRVVTASDYEALVLRTSGTVARASAGPKRERWAHGEPGTVEVSLVPAVPEHARGTHHWVKEEALLERTASGEAGGEDLEQGRILRALAGRHPVGTVPEVKWCRYKPVRVKARLQLHPGAIRERVRTEVLQELHRMVSPLSWPFGRPLLVADVYEAMLRNQGVNYAESVELEVDLNVGAVHDITPDHHQPRTYFAGADGGVFRSLNDGRSWERMYRLEEYTCRHVRTAVGHPGVVVAVFEKHGTSSRFSCVCVSEDCGETWAPRMDEEEWHANDTLLIDRSGRLILLLATNKGLREVQPLQPGGSVPINFQLAGAESGEVPISSLAVGNALLTAASPTIFLAVDDKVLEGRQGLSSTAFTSLPVPEPDQDRNLAQLLVERRPSGPRLWVGYKAQGDRGHGLSYGDLEFVDDPPRPTVKWSRVNQVQESTGAQNRRGWEEGTVYALHLSGNRLFVASHQGGVGVIDTEDPDRGMLLASTQGGLPVRGNDNRLFSPIRCLAARARVREPDPQLEALRSKGVGTTDTVEASDLLAGSKVGLFGSPDGRANWQHRSDNTVDAVFMPPGYLPVSGLGDLDHEVEFTEASAQGGGGS